MIVEKIDHGVTRWSKVGALILVGWFASSAYHGTLDLTQKARKLQTVETVTLPKLASVAGCQTKRANIAKAEAVKSENGADADIASIPNCAVPTSVLPAPHPVPKR